MFILIVEKINDHKLTKLNSIQYSNQIFYEYFNSINEENLIEIRIAAVNLKQKKNKKKKNEVANIYKSQGSHLERRKSFM